MNGGAAARRHPIRVLFIANRGEIAARIATTALRLGIAPVVPVVRGNDPGSGDDPGSVDLLDPAAVVLAALAAGADAVHPGYGFLAESPALAEAVIAAGLAWVGPPPEAIRTLGDKARARDVARGVGVPVAAGEEPDDQSDASLAAAAARVGLPLVVKPAAGGGGKGIRVVRHGDELKLAFETARREAARAFGDDRLILERFIAPARHVEVQVLADAHGAVLHLGDRDCSLQRRHQKVLEEAPAPGLAPGLRTAIRVAAIRVARAVGYEGAGTCEFLVADDGSWVFLEMNARLQVEHPVTELVLGRDLVADQLRIVEGATFVELGLDQADLEAALETGGHAIEVRLNAEDPVSGFLPSAGPVVAVRWPDAAGAFGPAGQGGIRVDAGIAAGDVVGGAFDPLLAKIVAHGSNRDEALVRLAEALDDTEVMCLVTNHAFLRQLVRLPVVREGRARTDTLEGTTGEAAVTSSIPDGAWQVAALDLAGGVDDDSWGGGWRLNAPSRLCLAADGPDGPEVRAVEPTSATPAASAASAAGAPLLAVRDGDVIHVSVGGRSVPFRLAPSPELARTASQRGSAGSESATDLVTPMPGTVLGVHVAVGSSVEAGDPVATLEAMKMEHVVSAPRAGRIAELFVKAGDRVERGRLVARLEVVA